MAATERIPVLMTKTQKQNITSRAKRAGLSAGEYMRRAAAGFEPDAENAALETMIEQMNAATDRAEQALDAALESIDASNKRIAAMEAKAAKRHGVG